MQYFPNWLTGFLDKLFWISCGVFFVLVVIRSGSFFTKKGFALKKQSFASELAKLTCNMPPGADFEIYLKNIESRLETLITANREMRDKLSWLEGKIGVSLARKEIEELPNSLEKQIYEAYNRGEQITEIAKSFGRNKGEIELILNIHRFKNNREGSVMIRGIYSGSAGMNVLQEKMNILANNLSNVNTKGFKRDTAIAKSFNEQLINLVDINNDSGKLRPIGNLCQGANVDKIHTYFTQGDLQQTWQDTDLALDGEGFFKVSGPEGDYYTREGSFLPDNDGYLISSRGYRLMGQNGPIKTEPGKTLKIGTDGKIYLDGVEKDILVIKDFRDPQKLEKSGNNYYKAVNGAEAGIYDAKKFTVNQGFLESSNVNMLNEMKDIIAISRAYETSQKMIQVQDELLGKAVNTVGMLK